MLPEMNPIFSLVRQLFEQTSRKTRLTHNIPCKKENTHNVPRLSVPFEGAAPAAQKKVASHKSLQALNQKSSPKHKEPRQKVATFTNAKVAT